MNQTIELLSLLYELSLTNLKHLTPHETAKNFIRKFLSRKSLHAGAVWVIDYYDEHLITFQKIYSIPETDEFKAVEMSTFHQAFGESEMSIRSSPLFAGEESQEGRYVYFKLGDFGLLELFHNGMTPVVFSKDSFRPFLDVITQFAVSLESGFSYQKLQIEIRQREEAEKLLKDSEEKYKRIIDNIKLGLMEVDNDEIIQHANKPFLELTGYELSELVGKNASEVFLDPDAKKAMQAQNESRRKGESSSYEISLRSKSGEEKWAIISGAPNYNKKGELIGSIGIHLDITEEKKLRLENEFKDTQLKKLFEKSLDALITMDADGNVFEWSPRATEIFGYTAEEIIGKKMSDAIIPAELREFHEKGMKHYLKTGEGPVLNNRIEVLGLRKTGEEFPIELTIFPLKYREAHYFTAFVRDITQIKASKENMEKALARQKELNTLKSKFISMTSHELRTPLTTIKSNTELLGYQLDHHDNLQRDRLIKNVSRINDNVERLNQLINNILMIGKLDSDKVPFNPERMDVHHYVTNDLRNDFKARQQTFKLVENGEVSEVLLDKKLFSHIIVNLLENAFKYSEGSQTPELIVSYNKDQLKISVKDYGIGIPEEDQEKLFETFYRASNVGNIQGTGLGLSIVKQFVELHGGSIEVESHMGEGTTFIVNFPIK